MQQSVTSKIGSPAAGRSRSASAPRLLAAILLIAYLDQYRSSVNDSNAATPVLVAKNLIPKGTSGTVIAEKQLFQAATLSKDDLKVGAISDPAYLNGRVAVARHLPRPADHDRRPQRRPHRRDPDPALREAARRRDPGRRRPRARRLRLERRPRRHLLRDRGDGGTVLGLLAPNVSSCARRRRDGSPTILRADAASPRSSRLRPTRARCGSSCARPATPRTPPKKSITSTSSSRRSTGQR